MKRTCLAAILPLLLAGGDALAADLTSEETAPVADRMASGWTLSVDPYYAWLPGAKGNLRVLGGPGVEVDVTTGDILRNLDEFLHAVDGLYMGAGEVRHDKFGFQWDIVYLDLGSTASFGDRVSGAADVGFKYSMTTLAGNYRFYETPTTYADAIAGVRLTSVDLDIAATLGPLGKHRTGSDNWADPIIGVKAERRFDNNWFVKGSALYGGFGVSSDQIYDLAGFLGYQFANGTQVYGGWRVEHTDYEDGAFKWDATLSGPMMGMILKF